MSISSTTKAAFKNQVRVFKGNFKNINKRFSLERSTITKLDLKLNAPVEGTDPRKWGIHSMFNVLSEQGYCINADVVKPLIDELQNRLDTRQDQLNEIRNLATAYTFTDIRTKVNVMKTELRTDYAKLIELSDACILPTQD